MTRRGICAAAVLALGLAASGLVGCSSQASPPATGATSASEQAIYGSREAATTAMRSAYEAYLAALSASFANGGEGIEAVRPLVTAAKFEGDLVAARRYTESGQKATGIVRLVNFVVRNADLRTGDAHAYVCLDVSEARVTDENGEDVTPSQRPNQQSLIIGFVGRALIDTSELWTTSNVC